MNQQSLSARVAILDLYDGVENQGMRCIRDILQQFAASEKCQLDVREFDVRGKEELPGMDFDIYISSGGPGNPLESRYETWDGKYTTWLKAIERFNSNPDNEQKKYVFFICHSFQLAARHFNIGLLCKRRSTAFGIFPVHMLGAGKKEPVFSEMSDPFYAVDSRDYQLIQPNHRVLQKLGAQILCIEKDRPHVPYERAVMGIRFSPYMIGTQFHPEADATGMHMYLNRADKKEVVVASHGQEKWDQMIEQLEDPEKIRWTYSHILPNFLRESIEQLQPQTA